MKPSHLIPLFALVAGLVTAQTVSTPGKSALYTGNGTGTAKQVFLPPDAHTACRASAASAPGSFMCKEILVTTCAAPAASSSVAVSCIPPLIGSWFQTTKWAVDAKTCKQISSAAPASAPTGACTTPAPTTWSALVAEGQGFTVTGTRQVRIGVEWASAWSDPVSVTGAGTCSMAFLGVPDPKKGSSKTCQVSGTAETVPPITVPPAVPDPAASATPHTGSKWVPIVTDQSKWPKVVQNPVGGWDKDMLLPTTEIAPASDIGAFRTGCQATKYAFDDPIVYPGDPGKSHLHTFFGNTGINAYSTASTLFSTGNSTCRGGTINRSSYWVPSMIDMLTGLPRAPMFESNFYYKTGYALPPESITEVPLGLRMIAGDAKGSPTAPSSAAIYSCIWDGGNANSGWSNSIPTVCPVIAGRDSWLIMGIDFPQCWDGVNLDSPDHKSHMTNPVNVKANNTGNCPASHPTALPQIAYQILYQVKVANETKNWRLSSDDYDSTKPAGYSGHGDYFMAWKPDIVKAWTKNCDNAQKDCHSHLLGDGRQMVIP